MAFGVESVKYLPEAYMYCVGAVCVLFRSWLRELCNEFELKHNDILHSIMH